VKLLGKTIMARFSWRTWFGLESKFSRRDRLRAKFRPRLEQFEERLAPAVYTVNALTDNNPGGGGQGTGLTGDLRYCITQSNTDTGAFDVIKFAIGAGPQTIALHSQLPALTHPVVFDGTSQPGYAGTPLIELQGSAAVGAAAGLVVGSGGGGSTIKGLVIDGFSGSGILLQAGGCRVTCNYIGTNPAGSAASPNADGVVIQGPGADHNTVGGTTVADRNVISGNHGNGIRLISTSGDAIQGNYIGTDATGSKPLPNAGDGVNVQSPNNIIGSAQDGITTVAGYGSAGYSGNYGTATSAQLNNPFGVAVDAAGDQFIADTGNNVIRKVQAGTGIITTVAGNGSPGYSGDRSPATAAQLSSPTSVAVDAHGNLFIADSGNNVIREVDAVTHNITTVTTNNFLDNVSDGLGGSVVTSMALQYPEGIAVDANGDLFIAGLFIAGSNPPYPIGQFSAVGEVDVVNHSSHIVVGTGTYGYSSDGGPAIPINATSLPVLGSNLFGVAVDAAGNLFIADMDNNVIREVPAGSGIPTTVAGNGTFGYSGDGGLATSAELAFPSGVAVDAAGDLFIADLGNNVIREVPAGTGIITTVAGNGTFGYSGDGGSATSAELNFPTGLAVDATGNLFIADNSNNVIREVRGLANLPPGESNVIAYNGGSGVGVYSSASSVTIRGNSIHDNTALGIGLASGANNSPNFPVLTAATNSGTDTAITGTFTAGALYPPNTTFTLDFYTNPNPAHLQADNYYHGEGQTWLGSATVTTDAQGNATFAVDLAVGTTGQWISATATDTSGNTSAFSADMQVASGTFATQLKAALPQSPTGTNAITIQASPSSINTVVAALGPSNLGPSLTPVSVNLNLSPGTYTRQTVQVPAGMTLYINGTPGTTIDPAQAALTVVSGNVVVSNVTFVTSGDAPTILVTGGSLTLRDDVVQGSTGFTDATISVTGGTLDLGTTADPGGNTINVNGTGEFVHNTTPNLMPAVGDTFEVNGAPLAAPTLSFTSLAANGATALLNQPVTFTATVRPDGAVTPSGSVDFVDVTTNTDLGSMALSGGTASLTTKALAAGNHVIQARYSGDGTFLPSLDATTVSVQYKFSGFLAPLNSTLAIGQGRTVPIKFQLTDYNGNSISSPSAVTSLQVLNAQGVNVLTNAGSTALRYDPTSKQWVANWQTKGLPTGTYTVVLSPADGTTHSQAVRLTTSTGPAGLTTSASGGTSSAPGGLLGGDIQLYVDNGNGELTADELARIQDAVTAVDAVTEPDGVAVQAVTDPTQADVTLNMDTTSAVGRYADGVLGCTTDAGQITIINGWNFYAGSDPTQIGAGQYDFQTVVTHELGHALGLGHSTDSTSVMYATLNTGTVNRSLTTADLNVPDSNATGACGLHAAAGSADGTPDALQAPAAPTAVEPAGNHLGSDNSVSLRLAVTASGVAPPPLTPASLAGAPASALAQGNVPSFNPPASAVPPALSLMPSWNQNGLGFGAFDSVLPLWAAGKAAGAVPETLPLDGTVSLPRIDPDADAVAPRSDDAPPAGKPPAASENEPAPLDGTMPGPVFPADPISVDAVLELFSRLQLLDIEGRTPSLPILSTGPKVGEPDGRSALEVWWLLSLAGSLAVQQGAAANGSGPSRHRLKAVRAGRNGLDK
jgi:hypothetical protein